MTVLERDARPGGLLMYGIPNMKLDKRVVQRRIELLQARLPPTSYSYYIYISICIFMGVELLQARMLCT